MITRMGGATACGWRWRSWQAEEAKWAALLGESRSGRTNAIREVRHKTLQVAQTRIRTALNRLTPRKRADDARPGVRLGARQGGIVTQ